jgi:transposase
VTARPLDAARDALIALQGQLIALLAAQNATLAARVAEVEAANAELTARVERLERAASRNSGNSSLPPSMDDQPGRTPPPARPKPAKGKRGNPGKQPGSPGWHLAWSENPGRTVPLLPQILIAEVTVLVTRPSALAASGCAHGPRCSNSAGYG